MRKDELEMKLAERQITLDESVKWTNEKMLKGLGDWTIEHSVKNAFCWGARYLQSLETVQLCRHLKDEMKSFEKAGINPIVSEDYVAEYKENGSRVFIYYDPATGFKFFSRRESVSTFLNNDLTNKILLISKDGLVTNPSDYKGKYNYRFILDGEVTVDGSSNFEGVDYGSDVEDLMQAIIGSLPDRAKAFQLAGNRFVFTIFDCIYFEKAPTGVPPEVHFDYKSSDEELTPEQVEWVESYFADYLRTAAFKSYSSSKKLYRYLYSLKNSLPNDIRKYPFIKRRKIRHALLEFLTGKGLPFKEIGGDIVTKDPLNFKGYMKKVEMLKEKTKIDEAVKCGICEIEGEKAVLAVMDGNFLMGSMGSAVGERITLAIETATKKKLPLVIFCVSGGARMQEGMISLMQMAKTSSALTKLDKAGQLYISVLTDPTTGGVTASFASLGDIILAEPHALIGFAGPRVIEQTINQKLPEGFQSSEFLLEHGFIDKIVERKDMKSTIAKLIRLHK